MKQYFITKLGTVFSLFLYPMYLFKSINIVNLLAPGIYIIKKAKEQTLRAISFYHAIITASKVSILFSVLREIKNPGGSDYLLPSTKHFGDQK